MTEGSSCSNAMHLHAIAARWRAFSFCSASARQAAHSLICCHNDFPWPEQLCRQRMLLGNCAEILLPKRIFPELCGSIFESELGFTSAFVWFLMSVSSSSKNNTPYNSPAVWAPHFFCGCARCFVFPGVAIWCQLLVLPKILPDARVNCLSRCNVLTMSANENWLVSVYVF